MSLYFNCLTHLPHLSHLTARMRVLACARGSHVGAM